MPANIAFARRSHVRAGADRESETTAGELGDV
jgi:hypothetical protein